MTDHAFKKKVSRLANIQAITMGLLTCMVLLGHNIAEAQGKSDEDWQKICERVKYTPFPAEDRPHPAAIRVLGKCSSDDLYYGFGRPADPEKARQCAYVEMENGDALVFGGSSILMTIYANGVGAKRNFDLAIKLACNIEGAPAEVEGRVEHLQKLKEQNWQGRDFSLCDDITSGFMQGHCTAHEQRFSDIKRKNTLTILTAKWSAEDKAAYNSLRKAADRFFEARTDNEVDLSGTARSAFIIEERASLEDDFADSLQKIGRGEIPNYSSRGFKDTDAKLNAVYQKIQKTDDFSAGTVTKEGIKAAQREWIRYRDTWVAFGQKKYQAVSADSLKAWLTEKRIKMLEEFLQ